MRGWASKLKIKIENVLNTVAEIQIAGDFGPHCASRCKHSQIAASGTPRE